MAQLRDAYQFPDDNGFVTMFVAKFLLESARLVPDLVDVEEDQLLLAVQAIATHREKAFDDAVPIYNFWNQVNMSDSQGSYWAAFPPNIGIPLSEGIAVAQAVQEVLTRLGLGSLWPVLAPLLEVPARVLRTFQIPADSDDTGCMLALGAELLAQSERYPAAAQAWASANADLQTLVDKMVLYSYDPFSPDSSKNTIDPRTYMWIRFFVQEEQKRAQAAGQQPTLSLVTTWFQNIAEARAPGTRGYKAPFNVDNVDASVVANALFGLTGMLLTQPRDQSESWFSPAAQHMYGDSARLLAFVLNNNLVSFRPDLMLLYYPPVYDFYFFVARLAHALESTDSLPYPVLAEALAALQPALAGPATDQLMAMAQTTAGWLFWDDFLGNADSTPSYDDRLFSTAMALNALMDIWTTTAVQEGRTRRVYKPSVPARVKDAVLSAAGFLSANALGSAYKRENAFFSGSVKSAESVPFFYPSNYKQAYNGSVITCDSPVSEASTDLIIGVSGVIPEIQYNVLLSTPCFGMSPPVADPGSNCASCAFPYWSSPALTDATALLALSKFLSAL